MKHEHFNFFTHWIYVISEFTGLFIRYNNRCIHCTLLLTGNTIRALVKLQNAKLNPARLSVPLASHCHYRHVVHVL